MVQSQTVLPETEDQLFLQVTETQILTQDQIGILKGLQSLTVIDDISNTDVSEKLAYVKRFAKILDVVRRKRNLPWEKQIKDNNALFRTTSLVVDNTVAHLNGQMISYFRAQETARIKEQDRLNRLAEKQFEKKIEEGKIPDVPEAVAKVAEAPQTTIRTGSSTTSIRTTMKWRPARPGISDRKKTSKVPDSYWMLDEKAIDDVVKGLKTQEQADEIFGGDVIIYKDYGTGSRLR